MALNREEAKRGITAVEDRDPELDDLLAKASDFQLKLKMEEFRHAEAMHSANLGKIGLWFGGEKSAATYIAVGAVILGGIVGVGSLIIAANQHAQAEFWSKQSERGFAFAAAALAYVFGRSSS